jgi:hypothetical protein
MPLSRTFMRDWDWSAGWSAELHVVWRSDFAHPGVGRLADEEHRQLATIGSASP